MTLKITFLGSGSAFFTGGENFQSNILFSIDDDTLLIDAGSDIRHSLFEQNLTYLNIKSVYLSHLHGDHSGGLEWLALTSYFDPEYQGKPNLISKQCLITDVWEKTLTGGLSTLDDEQATINTYYHIMPIEDDRFTWHSIDFKLIKTLHFHSNHQLMPSYGLIFEYNNTSIFLSTDTQYTPEQLMPLYEKADIIFHDCETYEQKSGVHAHYDELVNLPGHIKNKIWLYHYNPGPLPEPTKDGFLGFVKKGQCFVF